MILGRSPLRSLSTKAERRARLEAQLHIPVMADEVVGAVHPQPGQTIVDATFGAGGHTRRLLAAVEGGLRVVAADRDPTAFRLASRLSQELQEAGSKHSVLPVLGRLSRLSSLVRGLGVELGSVDAVLMDLGSSSMQLETPGRGFSLARDGPLDMRMDPSCSSTPPASSVVNSLGVEDLAQILLTYADETAAFRIARAIVKVRQEVGDIRSTRELARIVETVIGFGARDSLGRKAHPATKTFQALRIFVNDELNEVDQGMHEARALLKPKTGRVVVLSFHSLEDRIVKRNIQGLDPNQPRDVEVKGEDLWLPVLSRVSTPTDEEIEDNPSARSAKLRVACRSN